MNHHQESVVVRRTIHHIINNVAAEGEQILPDDQDHYFEFCCEGWRNSVVSDKCFPAENIIASCEPGSQINLQNLMSIEEARNGKPAAAEYYSFRWDGSHNSDRRKAETFMIKKEDQKSRKPSMGKTRWLLFLFGGTRRIQTEMALRDIRSRQSRLSPSSILFRLNNNGDDNKTMISNPMSKSTRSQQGLWGLLKATSRGVNSMPILQ